MQSPTAVKVERDMSPPTTCNELLTPDEQRLANTHEEEFFENPLCISFLSSKKRSYIPTECKAKNPLYEDASGDDLFKHFDQVAAATVARMEEHLPELARKAPAFAKQPMGFALPSGPPLQRRPLETTAARLASKGQPRRAVNKVVAKAIYKYVKESEKPLFVEDDKLAKLFLFANRLAAHKEDDPHPFTQEDVSRVHQGNVFHANAFTVDKTEECSDEKIPNCLLRNLKHFLQRIIVDGRIANAHLENPAYMEIFTLEALFDCFARCKAAIEKRNLGNAKTKHSILALSADLRHWFHQIPMPEKYRAAYALDLGFQEGRRVILFPVTWPMGASPAAGIGQAITWSLLLHGIEGDLAQRKALGIDWPEDNLKFDTYIPWLPLTCGGGIFVLIDNIFILTTNAKFRDAWKKRIAETAKTFNAELKHNKIDDVAIGPDGGSVDFTGVTFDWNYRRPREPIDQLEDLDNLLAKPDRNATWTCTYRQLASIIGQCLWAYRIAGRMLYDCPDYQAVAKAAYPKPTEDWSDKTTISGATLCHLLEMYKECRNENFGVEHPSELSACKSVGYLATDACFYGKAMAGLGFAYTLDTKAAPVQVRLPHESRPNSQIALEELRAVLLGIRHMRQNLGRDFPDLIILGIDSTHAKGMITNGVARTDEAIRLLNQIHSELGSSRLFLMFVPSAENPADPLSREDHLFSDAKWAEWIRKAQQLQHIATLRFKAKGSKIAAFKPRRTERTTDDNVSDAAL